MRIKPNLRAVMRKFCNEKQLKKKQKAFEQLRTTNHFP
jgi:hypothetical protein